MLKTLFLIGLFAFCANGLPEAAKELVGVNRCTWGPTYWCSNITNAAGCGAVKHCIQTVWEHQKLEPDTDTVCQTCMKMVKQARDQLESNETQEEIKEVFEGSCKLIPIKIITKECIKLSDEFIPELIDTLASQMNPQIVCSVAGLCNSDRIDKILEERSIVDDTVAVVTPRPNTCQGCHTVIEILEKKFDSMSKDRVLQSFLQVCGRLGSLSDSCSNIIVTYFTQIYNHLQNNFNPNEVCLMAGECSAQFHSHANVEITPLSNLGFVPVPEDDDLPCDLCKQLVGHLRDLLIANTTEDEFQRVLKGLCKQTGKFQNECLSIVTEYYPVIYSFLVNELNSTAVCSMVGICPNSENIFDSNVVIAPLLTQEAASKATAIMSEKADSLTHIKLGSDVTSVKILQSPESMQLPIERIMPPHMTNVYNRQVCVFCEYFLHYLQEAITNPKTETKIKKTVEEACSKLPSAVNDTCVDFVNTYGDAFVAILAQEIDPATICPLVRACPSENKNVEVFIQAPSGENSNCPLCLFAVTKLEELVKDKSSKDEIKKALDTLCDHLSGQVRTECDDFVNTYTDELIEMLLADLTPQEICVYFKLCKDNSPAPTLPPLRATPSPRLTISSRISPNQLTNEIGDYTMNGKQFKFANKPNCVLCEFVMSKLDELLEDKHTEDEIKAAVHSVCNYLPKSVGEQCNGFVDKYGDVVIMLLTQALKPSEICAELKFCDPPKTLDVPSVKSPECFLCKKIIRLIEGLLPMNATKADIEKAIESVCAVFPEKQADQCYKFMKKYDSIIADLLIESIAPGEICSLMLLCSEHIDNTKYEVKRCTVCETTVDAMKIILTNPKVDHGKEHVLEKSCRAVPKKYKKLCVELTKEFGDNMFALANNLPDSQSVCTRMNLCGREGLVRLRREVLVGGNRCTWGPSYWCDKLRNAEECGEGAKKHCQEKVWRAASPPEQ